MATVCLLLLGVVALVDAVLIEVDVTYKRSQEESERMTTEQAFEARTRSTPWHRAADGVREFLWWPLAGTLDAAFRAVHTDPYEGASVYGDEPSVYQVDDALSTRDLRLAVILVPLDALFWAWIGVAGWDGVRSLARRGALKNQGSAPGPGARAE